MSFSFFSETREKLPFAKAVFERIKNAVLGRGYRLVLIFISEKRSRELNKTYRGKDAPADILSFPLGAAEGEIYMNRAEAQRRAPLFGRGEKKFILILFIHGVLHLKGYRHGSKMGKHELKFRKRFGV